MIDVQLARGEDKHIALGFLLQDQPPESRSSEIDQLLNAESGGAISFDRLWLARQDGQPAGAALSMLQADGCAFVWPPRAGAGQSEEIVCDALLQAVGQSLDAAGAWLGQAILEPGDIQDRETFTRNGFEHLTDLCYLRRDLSRRLPVLSVQDQLDIVHGDPDGDAAAFGELIEQTYQQTADCPMLCGARTGMQAVEGHKASGAVLPNGWLIFRETQAAVGLVIFADQSEQDAWELVYMGVVPAARGRGFGREMLIRGLQIAQQSQRRSVLLAVDINNVYAKRIYESVGFEQIAVKSVHGRRPRGATASRLHTTTQKEEEKIGVKPGE